MNGNLSLRPGTEAIDGYFANAFRVDSLSENEATIWKQVLMSLSLFVRQGHTCLDLAMIANRRPVWEDNDDWRFPDVSALTELTEKALGDMRTSEALVFEQGLLYMQRYYTFEQDVVSAVRARSHAQPLSEQALARCQSVWPALFDCTPHTVQDWQQVAVAGSLSQPFCIINGGPGTGKTYTVTRLMLALQAMSETPLTIQLAAPTGKAAQRLKESVANTLAGMEDTRLGQLKTHVPDEAATLHRLLGVNQYGVQTRYHEENTLALDVLIVDEASMIDLAMMARLLRALPEHARLYLVGDADQLPAVESGNVLDALIHAASQTHNDTAGVHPDSRAGIARLCPHLPLLATDPKAVKWVHSLHVSQRFGGKLAATARAVQAGEADDAWQQMAQLDTPPEVFPEQAVSVAPLTALTTLTALARDSLSPVFSAQSPQQALAAINHCRWLTPVRRGPYGVGQLNALLESVVSNRASHRVGPHYQGRAVMVTRNHYAQNLFNGDVGVIWPDGRGQLKAWFERAEGGLRAFNLSRLPDVDTAFAMTIHKSQGSEFARVIMVLATTDSEQAAALYHRGLLYTGLTRAKEQCLILAHQAAFVKMVTSQDARFSGLRQRIHGSEVSAP
ncbi:exodeoxyribonuclease V subunit alpha [Alteromonas halophila]|uniref:RecBCD enzyme subunit RecD n=1 Tax=Alteromonas halophila TaxID=516698 RepID=A0A918JN14_9ALTE|nr:exodeoxyribonuclease V subunit alpha [Alteromonas halophila]GGW89718.1 RecBCD enzyme subunit RecD [Alteromonas halophila]